MKATFFLVCCALLAAASPAFSESKKKNKAGVPAATPEPVVETGFNAFRLVRLKNIFDPDRRPMPAEGVAKAAVVNTGSRTAFLVLTGTMVTEGRRLAFFSGSQSDFNKVVKVHDKLADCVIDAITTSSVDLLRGAEKFVLPVGQQISLGEKSTISNAPVVADLPPSSSPAPASPDAAPSAQIGAPLDPSEVMRRMMERRQKETR